MCILLIKCASLALFLVWVLLVLVNPDDSDGKWDMNFYDVLAALWAVGYISADIQVW